MSTKVYCTVGTIEQADQLVSRMKIVGLRSDEVIVADDPDEVENMLHPQVDFLRSTKTGVIWGLSVGLIVGLAQALYIGSAAFATAGRVLSIILWTAFGWGLYGAIVGGSGIFATEHIPKRLRQRIENEFKRTGIVVCAEPSYDATDIDAVKRELEAAGASNIYAERDA